MSAPKTAAVFDSLGRQACGTRYVRIQMEDMERTIRDVLAILETVDITNAHWRDMASAISKSRVRIDRVLNEQRSQPKRP